MNWSHPKLKNKTGEKLKTVKAVPLKLSTVSKIECDDKTVKSGQAQIKPDLKIVYFVLIFKKIIVIRLNTNRSITRQIVLYSVVKKEFAI